MTKDTKKNKRIRLPADKGHKIDQQNKKGSGSQPGLYEYKGLFQMLARHSRWLEVLGILIVVAAGLLVRLEDVRDWEAHPKLALYKGEPLLTTFDGYFYLSLAKDIVDGTYTPIDYDRDIPKGVPRRSPPPLLSVIGAIVAKITHASLNWVGAVLPAFLGLFLAIPLYGMGRYYGGPTMAITASLMGLLSFYYVYRSSLGWFDTDCMNVTWAVGITYAFMLFAFSKTPKRYLFFLLAVILYVLFLLWWDSAPAVVTVISLVPLFTALAFFYRPSAKEGAIFSSILCLAMVSVLVWQGLDLPMRIFHQVVGVFHYISTKKEVVGLWPSIGATISEEAVPTFHEVVAKTTDSIPAFLIATAGLIWLFITRPRDSLFLSVPVILGGLSFFFAKRFLIFLAPVTALGIGFVASELWRLRQKFPTLGILSPILVIALAYPSFSKGMEKTFWPKEPPHLIDGMVYAGKHTPKDAILWAWWDHGYPIIYFARRGTVGDGTIHNGEWSSYNGIPLATSSQRLSANFMCFYAAHGHDGIHTLYNAMDGDVARGQRFMKQVLGTGPEAAKGLIDSARLRPVGSLRTTNDWLRFFFPARHRPVYLFLDWRLTITSYWWFWLGTWDVNAHKAMHPFYRAFYGLGLKNGHITNKSGIDVDLDKGIFTLWDKRVGLKEISIFGIKKPERRIFNRKRGLYFEFFVPGKFGALMDKNIASSVFNALFLRHSYNPRYFKPVRLVSPSHQIWMVRGDKAS